MAVTSGDDAEPHLYLDGLRVGQRFTSGTHRDAREIGAFATRFDLQPFHLDDQAARCTLPRGLAASGWHTMRLLTRADICSAVRYRRD